MNEKQNNIKMNQNLLNSDIKQKFKKSFTAINIGFIVVTLIAITNIVMYASIANVNILSSHRGIIAVALLLIAVIFNITLSVTVSKDLSTSMIVPINELQNAVHKLKDGQFDINISYEGKDEFGREADFSTYYGNGYIGLDAMTAHTGKVNVLVVEDNMI